MGLCVCCTYASRGFWKVPDRSDARVYGAAGVAACLAPAVLDLSTEVTMFGLDLYQWGFLVFIAASIALVAGLGFVDYRWRARDETLSDWWSGQQASLRSLDSIWVMLVLFGLLLLAVFVGVAVTRVPEHWRELGDCLAFIAPCAAALVAGLGILRKEGEKYKRRGWYGAVPTKNSEAGYYALSIVILYVAVVGYVVAHFGLRLMALTICFFVSGCAIAQVTIFTTREWRFGRDKASLSYKSLFVCLAVLAMGAWVATGIGYEVLGKIDSCREKAENTAGGAQASPIVDKSCMGIE